MTKEKNVLLNKINRLLVSQNIMKNNNVLSDKSGRLQIHINSVKVSKCALEETPPAAIAQGEENQTKAVIIRLTNLQRKIKSQPQRVVVVKERALIGKESDPVP